MEIQANSRLRMLLIGGGGLGQPLAQRLARNHEVWVFKRTPGHLPDGIQAISGDIALPASWSQPIPELVDYVVYCVSPGTFTDEAYQHTYVQGLQTVLHTLQTQGAHPKRLFFVSSTSVYGQNDGEWVDEDSPTCPEQFSGKRLLEAEVLAKTSPIPATVVRFSGIYGGQRTRLLEQIKAGVRSSNPDAYTNRIHEDDCIRVLEHLIQLDISGATLENCYLASDCQPARLRDLENWVLAQLGRETRPPIDLPKTNSKSVRRAGSKRCSNQRLLASGYQFHYPDFRAGYKKMIELC